MLAGFVMLGGSREGTGDRMMRLGRRGEGSRVMVLKVMENVRYLQEMTSFGKSGEEFECILYQSVPFVRAVLRSDIQLFLLVGGRDGDGSDRNSRNEREKSSFVTRIIIAIFFI